MEQTFLEWKEELTKKKIAVIGAGVSNLPLLKKLVAWGCDVTLFDRKEEGELKEEIQEWIREDKMKASLGEHYLEKLVGFEVIFRSPSFLPINPYLLAEKERGAYVTTEVEQVIRFSKAKIIGVTGSKGKTTTTTIIATLLKNMGYHVYLGGNIGVPLFCEIEKIKPEDYVVLELSSFQLMGMEVSPKVAVVTNISPDHLDVHGSYEEYIEAKKDIFKHQDADDFLVLNADDKIVQAFASEAKGQVRFFGSEKQDDAFYLKEDKICLGEKVVVDCSKLLLRGKHNYLNICAALNAILEDIPEDCDLEPLLKKIPSVTHRLEFVRELNGVKWYNDSASTTPDKSMGGLYAFSEDIVLIAGGSDKNISYEPMAMPILEKVSKLILFGQTKNKIYEAVKEAQKRTNSYDLEVYVMDTLEEVVEVAYRVSVPGEVVLFSPASASFDMFQNAYQRGDFFKNLVLEIKD